MSFSINWRLNRKYTDPRISPRMDGRQNVVIGSRNRILGANISGSRNRVLGAKMLVSGIEILFWASKYSLRESKSGFGHRNIIFGNRNLFLGPEFSFLRIEILFSAPKTSLTHFACEKVSRGGKVTSLRESDFLNFAENCSTTQKLLGGHFSEVPLGLR